MARAFWEAGVCFECQRSGHCCHARDGYGYVYLYPEDRERLAAHFGLGVRDFVRRYCRRRDGHTYLSHPDRDCQFFDGRGCTVYEARPLQCRTWPFWPENMNARTWAREVVATCPGVGKGKRVTAAEIRQQLASMRAAARADERSRS